MNILNTKNKLDSALYIPSFSEIISKYEYFIFDCDGVIWNHSHIFVHAVEAINKLKKLGKNIFFLSNTNTNSRLDLQNKFLKCGIEVNLQNIYTSSFLISKYISDNYPDINHIYLIGGNGLQYELEQKGFTIYGGPENKNINILDKITLENVSSIEINDKIQACLCGFDENFNYFKIAYASQVISKTRKFFGTNHDRKIKVGKVHIPGTYSFIAALETCTETIAEVVTKPDPRSLEIIINDYNQSIHQNNLPPMVMDKILMIGDNLKTDIQFAYNNKIDSLCVLTGVTTEEDIKKLIVDNKEDELKYLPTYVLKNF